MDIVIVGLVVGAAVAYAGWKAWGMVKPGPKTAGGCACSSSGKGCAGCPVMDFKKR